MKCCHDNHVGSFPVLLSVRGLLLSHLPHHHQFLCIMMVLTKVSQNHQCTLFISTKHEYSQMQRIIRWWSNYNYHETLCTCVKFFFFSAHKAKVMRERETGYYVCSKLHRMCFCYIACQGFSRNVEKVLHAERPHHISHRTIILNHCKHLHPLYVKWFEMSELESYPGQALMYTKIPY